MRSFSVEFRAPTLGAGRAFLTSVQYNKAISFGDVGNRNSCKTEVRAILTLSKILRSEGLGYTSSCSAEVRAILTHSKILSSGGRIQEFL
jgi:hypothetical protein